MINKEEEEVVENGEENKDTCNQLHIAVANKFMTIHTYIQIAAVKSKWIYFLFDNDNDNYDK